MQRQYVAGTRSFNTRERHVAAPILRKEFSANKTERDSAVIEISAVGFYRLFLNGKEITKGCLAPYISNPDDVVYYDLYEVGDLLCGKNVLCILLGNGFSNSLDGGIWEFESAAWRSAPKVFACLRVGGKCIFSTDESFEVYDSPIIFDDYRGGEYYDARKENEKIFTPGYHGNARRALLVSAPKGNYRLCRAQPIKEFERIPPISVTPSGKGFIYDFGQNNAGVCRLKITSKAGRKISLTHGEVVKDGKLNLDNITFGDRSPNGIQYDEYICKEGAQEWQPSFTYHGFRYVYVEGIEARQATKELLTYVVVHSALPVSGSFECDDSLTNKIQECTLRSDLSCFHYFPTDCPQREKNGWTADAALSSEQMLYNFDCAPSLREWLHSIRKAQSREGALPGIVPTGGWGFEWGNGPAWDSVLIELPYQIYRFTGEKEVVKENAEAIDKYFSYLRTRIDGDGLLGFGLGDWCEAGSHAERYQTPETITDTLTVVALCQKTEAMFSEIGRSFEEITKLRRELAAAFRKKYVKGRRLSVETQTAYSMAIVLGMFHEQEEPSAYQRLKELLAKENGFRVGVIGQKYLFPLLFERGDGELAYGFLRGPQFPSYGYLIERGMTTLSESFLEFDEDRYPEELLRKDKEILPSLNHHFWGSVSGLFYEHLAGLCLVSANQAIVQPKFVSRLGYAKAEYGTGARKISVNWKKQARDILLDVESAGIEWNLQLPAGYRLVSEAKSTKNGASRTSFCICPI